WLRTAAGMSVAGASRLLTLAVELARLPRVREKFAAGQLAAGVVEAICTATANLSDEHAGVAQGRGVRTRCARSGDTPPDRR
ncbi:DUF222 domain-containing protein, partial [Microbispora rosea]